MSNPTNSVDLVSNGAADLERLARLPAEALLRELEQRFGKRCAIGTSFQNTGMVMIDMAVRTGVPLRVFTLDTLRLPEETYRHIERVESHFGIGVERFAPEPAAVERMIRQHGEHLFFDSIDKRSYCCKVRKEGPNARALAGLDGWITGLRRDQSEGRQQTPRLQWVTKYGRPILKVAPLAHWSEEQLREYIGRHRVPTNPLYERGYTTIGCFICTSPVQPGEAPRAGRWRWERDASDKECGLHLESGAGI